MAGQPQTQLKVVNVSKEGDKTFGHYTQQEQRIFFLKMLLTSNCLMDILISYHIYI